DFHRHYLQMGNGSSWDNIRHDTAVYPAFSTDLVPAMVAETERFFDSIVFAQGTFRDLLVSPKAFVNSRTAPLYGVEAPALRPAELTDVEPDPEPRPGFLTRLGFLNAFSSYARPSPIRRGAFIEKQVLGVPIPAPPPGADSTPIPVSTEPLTNRQQIDAL